MSLNAETSLKARAGGRDLVERIGQSAGVQGLRRVTTRAVIQVRKRPWIAGAIVLAALALGTWAMVGLGSGSAPQYIVATVEKGDIEDTVTALGNLQPRDYVDVGAQVSGQLKKLHVAIGDHVKQGQLLAEIDPQVLTAKVQQDQATVTNLRAQLADRQAQAALAQANYLRQKRLLGAGATSKTDYDAAQQAAASTAAQISALRAQVNGAVSALSGDTIQLGYTRIYAPMNGTVVSITTKQGQTIISSQQAPVLLRIADLSTMTVWTQVSEADVPKLHVGMDAYFTTLGDPGKRWTGKLTQIQPTPATVNNVVLYTATFDVKNPDNRLMTQMTAQVFFVTASAHDVVTVPVSALHQGRGRGQHAARNGSTGAREGGRDRDDVTPEMRERFMATRAAMKAPGAKRYTVLVKEASGTIDRRPVVVGVSSRVSAQVLAGLAIGDQVVVGEESTAKPAGASGADNRNRQGRLGGRGGMGGFGPR